MKKMVLATATLVLLIGAAFIFWPSKSPKGKILEVGIKSEDIPGFTDKPQKIIFNGLPASAAIDDVERKLKDEGFSVRTSSNRPVEVAGLKDGVVNAIVSKGSWYTFLYAEKNTTQQLSHLYKSTSNGIVYAKIVNEFKYSASSFGNRIVDSEFTGLYDRNLKGGVKWSEMLQRLSDFYGTTYSALRIPGRIENASDYSVFFDENGRASNSDGVIKYSFSFGSCFSKNPMRMLRTDDEIIADNGDPTDLCFMKLSFGETKNNPNAHVQKILKSKYIETFGEPDCWLEDRECSDKKITDYDSAGAIFYKMKGDAESK